MSDLDDSEYKFHYNKGRRLFKDGKIEQSLIELTIAFKINPNEVLQIKINKIEELINRSQVNDVNFKADENKILINDKFYVNEQYFNKLYKYQQDGVTWLFKLFQLKKGCILADDMGLGKTIQMIFYFRELFESDLIKSVLIIMPKSLLINWERELKKWAPSLLVLMYIANDKERNLRKIQRKGGILITTYGTVMHSWDELNHNPGFKWGILALDEGHKIKNPSSKTFKSVNALRADVRIVLTGTAVQNNLKELWALFDFTHQGSLLGSYPTFNREYEKPITDSRKKDSSQQEKHYGDKVAVSLKNLIKPFFLRRTKEEVINQINSGTGGLAKKNDLAIWIPMTEVQIDCYKKFLELDDIKVLLLRTEKRSPLLELNILKKICDHPRLLSPDQCTTMGLEHIPQINNIKIEDLIAESGKLTFLIKLVRKIIDEGCKCLIFSQSKVILSIIERILISYRIMYLRLDGDVLKPSDRQETVDNFNENQKYKILLLTLQVGGVGLTLTGADRVIIYDLSWNPSVDAQAVDRSYRIGQKKDVVIYRLITCGTVEEKIYRRQVFKDSLNRQTTGIKKLDDNTYRYFTQSELIELFTLGDPYSSVTQKQLHMKHSQHRKSSEYLNDHIKWLIEQNISGISDHDLLFSEADEKIYIDDETEVRLSANLRQAECNITKEAQLKSTTAEQDLRLMMSKMTINEPRGKVKEKYTNENMFIPSKMDLKRPVYNELRGPLYQSKIDDYISVERRDSNDKISVDLTYDDDDEDEDTLNEQEIQEDNSDDLIEESDNSEIEKEKHHSENQSYDLNNVNYRKVENFEKLKNSERKSLVNTDKKSDNQSESVDDDTSENSSDEINQNSDDGESSEDDSQVIGESKENSCDEINKKSSDESSEDDSSELIDESSENIRDEINNDSEVNDSDSDSFVGINHKRKPITKILIDTDEEEFEDCNSNFEPLPVVEVINNDDDDQENNEVDNSDNNDDDDDDQENNEVDNNDDDDDQENNEVDNNDDDDDQENNEVDNNDDDDDQENNEVDNNDDDDDQENNEVDNNDDDDDQENDINSNSTKHDSSNSRTSQLVEKISDQTDFQEVNKDESLKFEEKSLQDTFNESDDLLDETASSIYSE